MSSPEARHKVVVTCEGKEVRGWTEYQIDTSMIEPADSFSMRRPFDSDSWKLLRRDARMRVYIDDAPILDGFIDKRTKRTKDGTFEIGGRDRSGRLVQESAPRINYQGLELTAAILRLAEPWFTKVTLSDARNRKLRMGKTRRVPAGNEPLIVRKTANGAGRVQPGEFRWNVIEQLCSQAGLICWSSADGKELFVGRPNRDQLPSFMVRNGGLGSTCKDLVIDEDNGDRYSLIAVVGTGGGTEQDFGIAVSSRRAYVLDSGEPTGKESVPPDGTGRDFLYRKALLMPEKNFDSNADASRVAGMEQSRRDFRRITYTAEMPYHGQWITPVGATIFAPNTVALLEDYDFEPTYEDECMIYACHYKRSRKEGETTTLDMVPLDTEIIL